MPVPCALCGKTFKSRQALSLHSTMVHNSPNVGAVSTEGASTSFDATSLPRVTGEPKSLTPAPSEKEFKKPYQPEWKQQCSDCGGFYVDLRNHKKCQNRPENAALDANLSDGSSESGSSAASDVSSTGKQQCGDCGRLFVDLRNHRKCRKRTQGATSSAISATSPQSDSDSSLSSGASSCSSRASSCSSRSTRSATRAAQNAADEQPMSGSDIDDASSTPDVAPSMSGTSASTSRLDDERQAGTTRKTHLAELLNRQLQQLRNKYANRATNDDIHENPLLHKLSMYHECLSQHADSLVTEKVSAELEEVLADVTKVDDVDRVFMWTKLDETRLNTINAKVCLIYSIASKCNSFYLTLPVQHFCFVCFECIGRPAT